MRAFLRSAGVVILGIAIAGILIALIEGLNSLVYPLPADVIPGNIESMRAAMSRMPAAAFAIVVLAWTVGAFAGSWVAAMLADRSPRKHAAIVTAILLALGIANMIMLPHPAWVWVAAIAGFFIGGHLGTLVAQRSARR
jgi:hypothetical protein